MYVYFYQQAPESSKRNGLIVGYFINYKEYYSIPKSEKQQKVLGPLNFDVLLDNLTPYTLYEVTVSAFTSEGTGPASIAVRKSTLQGGNVFKYSTEQCFT